MNITVCIGSGCHVKGSRQIIEYLQSLIADGQLDAEIQLQACFCQNRCTEGVVVKVDEQIFTCVSPENMAKFLNNI